MALIAVGISPHVVGATAGVNGSDAAAAALRVRLEGDSDGLREGGLGGGGLLTALGGGNRGRQILYPEWLLGTWQVTSTVKQEKQGDISTYLQRFNATSSRKTGATSAPFQVVEDKGYNLQQVGPDFTQNLFCLLDPSYAKVVFEDGLGEREAAAAYTFATNRISSNGEGGGTIFYCSENFRTLFVASKSVQVTEYETITKLQVLPDDTIRGTQRVVIYSAPPPVLDKIAKMRSLGSLRAWGALTKGTVKEGSVGLNLQGGRGAFAVFDYDLLFKKE
eukprot:CAMPEP_0179434880 /NCGR_PEP_ID=MMETSP0799-20121207/19112_1 /TAXON_ID=46947 /ORGANISM="Geminigera cryophila, Strain CCMP2564" /LENGTH=276 /DNA_ID=CAMNT_0021213937 /DNA_START=92 /DNA_END=923 /DNA_ORIENTATION=-